jgi:hypothetical protein
MPRTKRPDVREERRDTHGRVTTTVIMHGAAPTWEGKTEWARDERRALVERVMDGDQGALPELRAMFAAHPDAAVRVFDPARTLHADLAAEMSDPDDLLFPELVMARADALRRELEGEHPTALERLLCERAATCWLVLHFLEIRTPSSVTTDGRPPSLVFREQHDHMVTRAHERYMSALLTLAKVRRLLRPEVQQVNIAAAGAQQLNMAGTPSALPGASAER